MTTTKKIYSAVSVVFAYFALLAAILLLAIVMFLSSVGLVEASHGRYGHRIDVYNPVSVPRIRGFNGDVAALVGMAKPSPFETGSPPISWVHEWPQLPSTAEQQIKLAKDKIAVFVVEQQKEREALRLRFDTQRLYTATGMACLFGGIMVAALSWPVKPKGLKKSPFDTIKSL